jgi:hypothetical protein
MMGVMCHGFDTPHLHFAEQAPNMIKRILLILMLLIVVAQFIRPDRSVPAIDPGTDLLVMTNAPADIRTAVRGACYDCHSYETDYPWYASITPINWWLQGHINEGREELNFSRWDRYVGSKAAAESGEEMLEKEMPPVDYTWMHGHARLDPAITQKVVDWFNALGGAAPKAEPAEAAEPDMPGTRVEEDDDD